MLIMIFKWWYGPGWSRAFKNIKIHTVGVSQSFSIPILLKTLFAPWHRMVSYPGRALDDKFRAIIDNLVSRLVGFVVRLMVLFTAALLTFLTAVGYGLLAVLWPLFPIIIIYCLVKVVIG
ncbi:MAG: hypothetical protein WCP03_04230 [Candidatus Saccharibacteria bacterium]